MKLFRNLQQRIQIPGYVLCATVFMILFSSLVYWITGNIALDWKHYDLTLAFDRRVPLIPVFVWIYIGWFPFVLINYIILLKQGKAFTIRFLTADLLAKFICGVCFLVLPTTNIRPELTGDGFCIKLLQGIYLVDEPVNLFPSIHCMVSWLIVIGMRNSKKIPKLYRFITVLFAVLICISTQFIKQHYIVDLIAGIAVAEVTWYIGFCTNLYKGPEALLEKGIRVFCKSNSADGKES